MRQPAAIADQIGQSGRAWSHLSLLGQ
jgi:hypothetical protein